MKTIVSKTTILVLASTLLACGETSSTEDGSIAAAPSTPEPEPSFLDLTGDAAAGEIVFGQCRTCHQLQADANGIGPTLFGVIGREAGAIEGFADSPANAESTVVFTPEVMFDYIASPREYIPGTRMAFPGLRDAQDRADLIAFLETQSQ